ncbi:MAG: sigma-54-dependent Fis family transcriptional regulator [PVC group bacterium]|nr:sigma-54-dependent Fis family transcriptional regulator [PVC group bacterium]
MNKEYILVVDDERGMREYLKKLLTDNGYAVVVANNGMEALTQIEKKIPVLAIIDFKMPGMDGLELLAKIKEVHQQITVIMMTAYGTMENAIKAMKLGAYDYLNKPFELDEISLVIDKAFEKKRLEEENIELRRELKKAYTFEDIVSSNDQMRNIFDTVQKIADTKSTILIQGETGTGKELIARAIHNLSQRKNNSFIPVDCSALTTSLLESELFGHVKGAFTGASTDKKGLFEAAHGGTIFLDEIGHISLEIQSKLLRVLQDGEIKRVGEALARKVDIRLIAASNENLERAVKEGRFRQDLYYRLNVVPLSLPALRERTEDIPILIEHFIKKYNHIESKKLENVSPEVLKILMDYQWPGNVRELENLIHRAVVMEVGPVILPSDLPAGIREPLITAERRDILSRTNNFRKAKRQAMEAFERRFLAECLIRNKGNVSKTAKEMGLDRRNLQRKCKYYKINPGEFK